MNTNIDKIAMERALGWLAGNFDQQTKERVKYLMENDKKELTESFYQTLEFGTGGLRGIMGVGTNRMNVYTVGMATQGLANYLKRSFQGEIKVAIAYDCRNNSPLFAQTTAEVFAANGFIVYLFDTLHPTPLLSFTIRHLGCKSGVVVTASHNPKEYNGYKAYWDDGAQVVAPHDTNIIDEVQKITDPSQVKFKGGSGKIISIGSEIDEAYIEMVKGLSLSPEAVAGYNQMKIVYTPIHGTGVRLVPKALASYGFTNIINVPQQDINDGDFPTVVSPNPEDPAALKMALDKAVETGADLVMATDPDADRQAIAVRDKNDKFVLLNGNQSGSLLIYYLLTRWQELGKLNGNQYVIKTIVTTELIRRIAASFDVECYNTLTGFKFIAAIIRENEGEKEFVGGGEESYGFMVGDKVRDKDGISSLSIAAECAAWAASQNKNLLDILKEMYVKYGFYKEGLVSITRKGQQGQLEIRQMMADMRTNPPAEISGSKVVEIHDFLLQKNTSAGVVTDIEGLPKSDVLQFVTADGTIVSMRPSGTEPKIKFYFGVREDLPSVYDYDRVNEKLDAKIERIKLDLNLI